MAKNPLTPPPVAPSLLASSFQVTSAVIFVPDRLNRVPPQPRMKGLDAGKSTVGLLSEEPSVEPLSPEAARTVTPTVPASWQAALKEFMACCVHELSGPPQLMEMIEGRFVASWTAVVRASRKPLSVLVVKYTASCAAGATAPTISMSSSTSPSGPSGLPVGAFEPPSTGTTAIFGGESLRPLK